MKVLTRANRDTLRRLRARDEFFWLDLVAPTAQDLDVVGEELGLHPLALEDTREFRQRPKFDRYDEKVLLVYYSARILEGTGQTIEPVEVHLHVSGAFVFSARQVVCAPLTALHDELVGERRDAEDYLVYRILDGLTDACFPVLERVEERVDALEGAVLDRARSEHLGEIYRLKQEVHDLLRRIAPQRDQFEASRAAILELPGFSRGARDHLADVGDHLEQVAGELARQNDDLASLTATYFSARTNRLSALATRLTVIATAFFVWTLVTSFFGQNFGWLVANIDSRTDFLLYGVGGLVVPGVAFAAYYWRKRSDWT